MEINSSFTQIDKSGLDYGEDLDRDGRNETVDVHSEVTVRGLETITIPLGTFTDCLKVETNLLLTLTLSANEDVFTVSGVQTTWFTPGVGFLKNVMTISSKNISENITEVLRSYVVDGTKRGIMPDFTIARDVAPGSSNDLEPGRPSIGYDGTNYLVVTRRMKGATETMVGDLISPEGTVLKTFQVFDHGVFPYSSIAFDGTNYLVVYPSNGIRGQRVTPAGTVLDGPSGFRISSVQPTGSGDSFPAVAFDGDNYLVVWSRYKDYYSCGASLCRDGGRRIYAARVDKAGQVLGEFRVSQKEVEQQVPYLAFNGTNYLVLWGQSSNSYPYDDYDIYGARIIPEGTVLDTEGIAISTASGVQWPAQIISDGTNFFALWMDERNVKENNLDFDVYGTRIDGEGKLLDGPPATGGIPINTAPYAKEYLTATFTRTNYFVAWKVGGLGNYPPAGIFGVRVSTDGILLDGPAEALGLELSVLSYEASYFFPPAIFSNGINSLLVWVNQSQVRGSTKDIRGVLIYP